MSRLTVNDVDFVPDNQEPDVYVSVHPMLASKATATFVYGIASDGWKVSVVRDNFDDSMVWLYIARREEPPEPDYNAPSAHERHVAAWEEKRRLS